MLNGIGRALLNKTSLRILSKRLVGVAKHQLIWVCLTTMQAYKALRFTVARVGKLQKLNKAAFRNIKQTK